MGGETVMGSSIYGVVVIDGSLYSRFYGSYTVTFSDTAREKCPVDMCQKKQGSTTTSADAKRPSKCPRVEEQEQCDLHGRCLVN